MARFAQELRERREKNRRKHRKKAEDLGPTIRVEGEITEPGVIREKVASAVATGLERMLDKMVADISDRAPSSKETGTRLKWSRKTAEYHQSLGRLELKDSIRWRVTEGEDGDPVGEIYIDDNTEWIARFVEYGHELVLWGHETGETMPPRPFMRPGYEAARPNVVSDVAAGMRKEIE